MRRWLLINKEGDEICNVVTHKSKPLHIYIGGVEKYVERKTSTITRTAK